MTSDEYNKLFHKTQANLVAFQPLMQCDHEVIKMIEAAVEAEREACAKVCEVFSVDRGMIDDEMLKTGVFSGALMCAAAIRARGQG